ncbi:MAG: NADH-quinone oxidoreductase subunit G, partial [Dietzia sp.]|nr:NADH-quinone oxidoreductase subunit G [Dietzia sp.]
LTSTAMADHRVLDAVADAMGVLLGVRSVSQVHAEIDQLGGWDGDRGAAPEVAYAEPPRLGDGEAVLATWHLLLDAGRCQDGERFLAGTAQRPVLRLSAGHAAELGVGTGDAVTVRTDRGQVTLPLVVTPMPDGVVWLPQNSTGSTVRPTLGVDAGAVVRVQPAALAVAPHDGEDH